MGQEILYTSAKKGLKPGSRGFCTVLSTPGMAANLAEALESLSGYRHAFPPHESNAKYNPVNYSHLVTRISGQQVHILSRISDAGVDYTNRSNKLAHHVALATSELTAAGPAAVLLKQDFCRTSWDGNARIIEASKSPKGTTEFRGVCNHWKKITGDAGWAGYIAEHLINNSSKPISIIYPKGLNPLPLVHEILGLLPAKKRWMIGFSTYFTKLPAGYHCPLRFILDETKEAAALRRHPHEVVVDLASQLGKAQGGDLVELARKGVIPQKQKQVIPEKPSATATSIDQTTKQAEVPTVPGNRKKETSEITVPDAPPEFQEGLSKGAAHLKASLGEKIYFEKKSSKKKNWLLGVAIALLFVLITSAAVIIVLRKGDSTPDHVPKSSTPGQEVASTEPDQNNSQPNEAEETPIAQAKPEEKPPAETEQKNQEEETKEDTVKTPFEETTNPDKSEKENPSDKNPENKTTDKETHPKTPPKTEPVKTKPKPKKSVIPPVKPVKKEEKPEIKEEVEPTPFDNIPYVTRGEKKFYYLTLPDPKTTEELETELVKLNLKEGDEVSLEILPKENNTGVNYTFEKVAAKDEGENKTWDFNIKNQLGNTEFVSLSLSNQFVLSFVWHENAYKNQIQSNLTPVNKLYLRINVNGDEVLCHLEDLNQFAQITVNPSKETQVLELNTSLYEYINNSKVNIFIDVNNSNWVTSSSKKSEADLTKIVLSVNSSNTKDKHAFVLSNSQPDRGKDLGSATSIYYKYYITSKDKEFILRREQEHKSKKLINKINTSFKKYFSESQVDYEDYKFKFRKKAKAYARFIENSSIKYIDLHKSDISDIKNDSDFSKFTEMSLIDSSKDKEVNMRPYMESLLKSLNQNKYDEADSILKNILYFSLDILDRDNFKEDAENQLKKIKISCDIIGEIEGHEVLLNSKKTK